MQKAVDVSMVTDYFTKDGLTKKTGLPQQYWDYVILKESIDNALDAIEPCDEKRLVIDYDPDTKILSVFDNGSGIRADAIENSIYNFSVYHSSKRHYVTASRGKQGNGLKTVISICHLNGYDLLWHTAEGQLLQFLIDDSRREAGEITVNRQDLGQTGNRGITVTGFSCSSLQVIVEKYSDCNPDVNIIFRDGENECIYKARTAPVDRSDNTNIAFYDLERYRGFLSRQDGGRTYKQILQETFGTAIANKSGIKGKLKDIDLYGSELAADFEIIRRSQAKKKFTALKPHMIGLDHHFFTEDQKTDIPYCVEFSVSRLPEKSDGLNCACFVNNSITYLDGRSIKVAGGKDYQIGTRKTGYSYNLHGLLKSYPDFFFVFHFISPQLSYMDTGKVSFDISGIAEKLCEEVTKVLNREQRQHRLTAEKPPSNRGRMRAYLSEAFELASSGGKYSITARQLYYKVRELSGIDETKNTYADFTQNILTEWLEQNPAADEKVFFAERGKYFIGSDQEGLGTGNVRKTISADRAARNQFVVYGGLTENIYLQADFDIGHGYDKALYIEKTGFDHIFMAEGIAARHHMIILSGQGFITRAGKEFLYYLQNKGLRLYCLHDLDYSGVSIINALREPNEKFPEPLYVEDLGITFDDILRYGITPERVTISAAKYGKIDQGRYTPEQQRFFFRGDHLQRVELNAFSTAQILEIIDRKLSGVDTLPRLKLSQALNMDPDKLKEAALMRVLKKRFGYLIDQMPEPDIEGYDEDVTIYEARDRAEGIKDAILLNMEQAADVLLDMMEMQQTES